MPDFVVFNIERPHAVKGPVDEGQHAGLAVNLGKCDIYLILFRILPDAYHESGDVIGPEHRFTGGVPCLPEDVGL